MKKNFAAMMLVLLVGIAPQVRAQFLYSTNSGGTGVTVTLYLGGTQNVVIPAAVGTLPVTQVGEFAFDACNVSSVSIPATVTEIGDFAFNDCANLTIVTFSTNLASIGEGAFYGCAGLTSVALPNSVTNLGIAAFTGCAGLTTVTLGSGLTSLPDFAFYQCSGLTNVIIPGGVTGLGYAAFYGCSGLAGVTLSNGLISLGDFVFDDCTNLGGLLIPASVANLGAAAFAGCSGLTNLVFLGDAPATDGTAFQDDPVAIGYLSGTTGWTSNSTYGGLPAQLQLTITSQPASQSLAMGGTANFGVTVADSPLLGGLNYQWYRGTNALTDAGRLTGSISPALTISNVQPADANSGNYWVVVSDNYRSVTSSAAVLAVSSPYVFTTRRGGITITSYVGAGGNVVIPPLINDLPVIAIGAGAFSNCPSLTGMAIPNSVTNIGSLAFAGCGLTDAAIPASVTYIGSGAFAGCDELTNIVVDPANSNYASTNGILFDSLFGTLLAYPGGLAGGYVIPSTVTGIGGYAFGWDVNLTSVTVPGSVTSVGSDAFINCTNLTDISFFGPAPANDGTAFAGDMGFVNYLAGAAGWGTTYGGLSTQPVPLIITSQPGSVALTYGDTATVSVTALANASLGYQWYCETNPLADGGEFSGVTSSNLAIAGIQVTNAGNYSVVISDVYGSVTSSVAVLTVASFSVAISNHAITITGYGGAGGGVDIPALLDGLPVTAVGPNAFVNYASLTGVTLPSSVTSIGAGAFSNCPSLTEVTIPNDVTSIGSFAFLGCGLTNVAIPASVTYIGSGAFAGCDELTNIVVDAANPDYASTNGVLFDSIFATLLAYPGGLAAGYVIPSNVSGIGGYAFGWDVNLTRVTVQDTVTNIGSDAFIDCANLTGIMFFGDAPGNDGTAFAGDSGFVDYLGGGAGWGTTYGGLATQPVPLIITNQPDGQTLTLGAAATFSVGVLANPAVTLAYQWYCGTNSLADGGQFSGSASADLTLSGIQTANAGNYSVVVSDAYGSVTSSNAVLTVVPFYVANNNNTLAITGYGGAGGALNIPASINGLPVTDIGAQAFASCFSLTSVTIPDSVTNIEDYAFSGCYNLSGVSISTNVVNIGDGAFYDCGSLAGVTIPGSVVNIGDSAFFYCYSLTNVTLPNSVTNIGDNAFFYCASLTNVTISTNIAYLADFSFSECRSLTSVTIPNGVAIIGPNAFGDDWSLWSVTIPATVTLLTDQAFANCGSLYSILFEGYPPGFYGQPFYDVNSYAIVYYLPEYANYWQWEYPTTYCGLHTMEYYPWMIAGLDDGDVPVITGNPATQVVAAGGAAGFQVTATGSAPLNYQWYFNQTALPGATESTLSIAVAAAGQAGLYQAAVWNASGTNWSAAAALWIATVKGNGSGLAAITAFGPAGAACQVQYATNLAAPVAWAPLQTATLATNACEIVDPGSAGQPRRFYRLVPQ